MVEVNHTERTWADEILKLVENSLDNIIIKEPASKKFVRSILAPLNVDNIFFALFLLVPVYTLIILQTRAKDSNSMSEYLAITEKGSMSVQALHQKLDIISTHLLTRNTGDTNSMTQTLIIYLGSLLFFGIFIYIINLFIKTPDSFIVLTNATTQYKKEILQKYKSKLWIASILGTVLLGLIINYIFNFLQSFHPL